MQHVMFHMAQRDSTASKFDRVEVVCVFALFHWHRPLTLKEGAWGEGRGRKAEYLEETPDN